MRVYETEWEVSNVSVLFHVSGVDASHCRFNTDRHVPLPVLRLCSKLSAECTAWPEWEGDLYLQQQLEHNS